MSVLTPWLDRAAGLASGPAAWLALVVGLLLLVPAGGPTRSAVLWMLALGALLAVSLRWRIGPLVVGALFLAGLHLRLAGFGMGHSDVLTVTRAAIELVTAGGNPYGHGYAESVPPGAPFAYGPLTLFWYGATRDPRLLELAVSILVLGALAVRGRMLGLAVYALAPTLISTASDGSNDTSAGLLLLVALLVTLRAPRAGALLIAVAFAFKPYAAAWLVPLVAWAGLPALAAFAAGAAALWGPAVVLWSPAAILESFRLAEAVHGSPSFSLAYALDVRDREVGAWFERLRLLVGAAVAVVTWPFVDTGRAVIVSGLLIFLATLFTGFWSTFAYLSAIAPLLCWHLDDWTGLGGQRVRWPDDPVGRVTAAVDRRWPLRGRLGGTGAGADVSSAA